MKFRGDYTAVTKKLLEASAVAKLHAQLLSPPGWGKTEMAFSAGKQILGEGNGLIFLEIAPSTPPEVVTGSYDPAELLNGRLVKIIDGTPYDPTARIIMLDEMWRANDLLLDSLVHALSMKMRSPLDQPLFWATSNFTGSGERMDAVKDRFALWLNIQPDLLVTEIVQGHLASMNTIFDPDWAAGLPAWEDCLEVQNMTPTENSVKAITDVIDVIEGEARAEKFDVNPRRLVQWSTLLFRMSAYRYGSPDFGVVHPDAHIMLKYAMPIWKAETAQKWSAVINKTIDQVGVAVEEYMAMALTHLDNIKNKSGSNRTEAIANLGIALQNAHADLKKIGGNDARVVKAVNELNQWFAAAVSGMEVN